MHVFRFLGNVWPHFGNQFLKTVEKNIKKISIIYSNKDINGSSFLKKIFFLILAISLRQILPLKITNTFPSRYLSVQISKRITRKKCKIYSKLTIITPERHQRRLFGLSLLITLNIFHIFFLVFLLLTLNR